MVGNNWDKYLKEEFESFQLSKQVHTIENIIWQLSNDLTLLEHVNMYIDRVIDLITSLRQVKSKKTFNIIKQENNLSSISLLLVLIVHKFTLNYLLNLYYIYYIDF